MSHERWHRIEEVYHSALERTPDQRPAFLTEICGSDDELRREVESLLRHGDSQEALVDRPAWEAAGELLGTSAKDWSGQTVSHYQILEKLGEGGMGVVYKARDSRLGRTVALKFLAADRVAEPSLRQRFHHEAQAAAALDHPNICTVYEIDERDGETFLAMAFVDGPTLREKIEQRPLGLEEAIGIAIQIGEGLEAAHERGIVHRDVKSANILLTPSGQARITDFGLATLADRTRLTQEGAIVGTPQYMSPEQARGEVVDRRSDLWSLGVVLYEMVCGQLPFGGETAPAAVFAVLHKEPEPLTALRSRVPMELDRIVAKALAKNPAERYQHAADILVDLRSVRRLLESRSGTSAADRAAADTSAGRKAGLPAIAVLAFNDMSPERDQEYFCDGIAEEILNGLARIEGLHVASRTSAFRYKGQAIDIGEIGRQLKVDTLLEGSVRKSGDRLRITAQLINVADGFHLWSERYDRTVEDVFAIQDEISQAVVAKLRVQLVGEQPLIQRRAANVEAYNLNLKGRHWGNKFTGQGWRKAIECFERAIIEDPNYASPHAGLAVAYTYLAIHGWARPREVMPSAKTFALKALELDQTLAEAHFALAYVREFYEWDWQGAESEYQRAIELSPKDALSRIWHADLLVYTGRADAAFAEAHRAWELEPVSEEVNRMMVYISFVTGRYDEAVAHGQKAVELYPHGAGAHNLLGFAYAHKGQYQEAIRSLQEASTLAGGDPLFTWGLGYVYALQGRRSEAVAIVERLEPPRSKSYFSPTLIAGLYGALGELDRAFQFLETAYEERDGFLVTIGADPTYGSLRADPRCQAMLKKINLA